MKTPIRKKREGFFGKATAYIGNLFVKKDKDEKESKKKYQGATNRIHHLIGGGGGWNPQAIFIPRHGKQKGYERDNRDSGRKHHRKNRAA
jgi:hypothetical protein